MLFAFKGRTGRLLETLWFVQGKICSLFSASPLSVEFLPFSQEKKGEKSLFSLIFKVIDYERFNRNSFSIHSWSWNYRGCWHQTCPPIVTCKEV
jgi:hypothetical protein